MTWLERADAITRAAMAPFEEDATHFDLQGGATALRVVFEEDRSDLEPIGGDPVAVPEPRAYFRKTSSLGRDPYVGEELEVRGRRYRVRNPPHPDDGGVWADLEDLHS